MRRMKTFTPQMYLDYQVDDSDTSEDLWEQRTFEYLQSVEKFPEFVQKFIRETGSLHDGTYKIEKNSDGILFTALYEPVQSWDEKDAKFAIGFNAQFFCEHWDSLEVFPSAYAEVINGGEPLFLYDEFQLEDDGTVSYHFFDSEGIEHCFNRISNIEFNMVLN